MKRSARILALLFALILACGLCGCKKAATDLISLMSEKQEFGSTLAESELSGSQDVDFGGVARLYSITQTTLGKSGPIGELLYGVSGEGKLELMSFTYNVSEVLGENVEKPQAISYFEAEAEKIAAVYGSFNHMIEMPDGVYVYDWNADLNGVKAVIYLTLYPAEEGLPAQIEAKAEGVEFTESLENFLYTSSTSN